MVWLNVDDGGSPLPTVTHFDIRELKISKAFRDFMDIYNPPVGTKVRVYLIDNSGRFFADQTLEVMPPKAASNSLIGRYGQTVTNE